ncbi:MAG: hypothetical protein COA78_17085 [Blastopirellula sp.]|nr:MAG: hypothetical protein COA78_17085 [Blastopirellula sp.]
MAGMTSRRKRKRERRRVDAEATVNSQKSCGGWGEGLPTRLSDLVMLRRAIKEDWPVPQHVKQAVVGDLEEEVHSSETRRVLSSALCFLAMSDSNLRLLKNLG